ncbi:sigma-70 family RNA polymerase sigma factor [Senegalia massiliensis]|uniref:Sigma-70 family RNA polymerase sigma factor n=1 Tax=Senegalia massiliensis TaxID=1720316 RepID=A0A845QZ35_9CLOT|nr:sigma-70 family RNA polymerase sigma factor [Senegalia massiliensis]
MTSEEFENIYQIYFKDIYYYMLSLSKDKHIAEDITSETFLKAIKSIDKFRGDTKLRVWLCQIAKNEYFSYLRKNKKVDFRKDLDDIIEKEEADLFEKDIISNEGFIKISNIIRSSLKEPYNEIFRLRVYDELSFKEIGNIFGKTDNWACVTYHRARKKIQKELEGKS